MQKMTLKHNEMARRFIEEHHDNCTVCNRLFANRDATHLGYNSNKKLIYVGNCCSDKLSKTIIRHIHQKRQYSIPENQTVLWRFMDFTKFVSLLKSRALYFTRADQFEDPFEGAKGLLKNKKQYDKHYLQKFSEIAANPPENSGPPRSKAAIKKNAEYLLNTINNVCARQLSETFINCWHENSHESEAMWKLYTSTLDQGIAIKTTYKKLYNALGRKSFVHIGRINYVDFNNHFSGINDSFWYKRKSFEHEKEVRAIMIDYFSKEKTGWEIHIDLNVLIDKIYVSPTAPPWFIDLVKDVLVKYKVNKKII